MSETKVFLDTNVLIGLAFTNDARHAQAKALLALLSERYSKILVQPLVLAELHAVISRRITEKKLLAKPFQAIVDSTRNEAQAVNLLAALLIKYVKKHYKVEPATPTPHPYTLTTTTIAGQQTKLPKTIAKALTLAPTLKLKSMDLLILTEASILSAQAFATLDEEIEKKADAIKNNLGIEVITIQSKRTQTLNP